MNQEPTPTEPAPVPAPAASGPTAGQMLRGAREARGVSLEELVSETRINRVTLEALEADRKPPQDAAVFVRGYFKRCAKVLGIDESALIQAYEARAGRPAAPQPVTIQWNSNPEYTVKRVNAPSWLWPVLIGGTIFGLVLWGVAALKDDEPDSEQARSASAPRAPRVVELTPRTVPNEAEATEQGPPDAAPATPEGDVPLLLQPAPPLAEGAAPDAAAPVEGAPAQAVPGIPAGQYALFMEFSAACWTVVTDNDNDRLLYGMFKAGDRKEVIGEPPYRVSLGYAPGVKLYYEGKPVDFSAKVTPGDVTARFVVPF